LVTSSLRCSYHPRGPRHDRQPRFPNGGPSSSKLQPTSGFPLTHYRVGNPEPPWVLSLSAPSSTRRDEQDSSLAAPRSQVFATSQQVFSSGRLTGLFHPASTRRVWAFRVLPRNDRSTVFQFRASSPLPLLHGFLPYRGRQPLVAINRDGSRISRYHLDKAPSLLRGGCHLGVRSTLELYSRFEALRSRNGFTHSERQQLSWPSASSGFSISIALACAFPFQGSSPS